MSTHPTQLELTIQYPKPGHFVKVKLVNIRKRVIDDETFFLYDIELNQVDLLKQGDFRMLIDAGAHHILFPTVLN